MAIKGGYKVIDLTFLGNLMGGETYSDVKELDDITKTIVMDYYKIAQTNDGFELVYNEGKLHKETLLQCVVVGPDGDIKISKFSSIKSDGMNEFYIYFIYGIDYYVLDLLANVSVDETGKLIVDNASLSVETVDLLTA